MPFEIVRHDIVNMRVDAIVNTPNPRPVVGSGVDTGIHAKAGPKLLEARKKIGDIALGEAVATPGFDLDCRYVIHTVGPVWQGGGSQEETHLYECYVNSLMLARKKRCKSIAFPLISTGNYGFPRDWALQIAIRAFSDFLMIHEMQIYLVVFNREAYQLSEKLVSSVASYIDEHYVDEAFAAEYSAPRRRERPEAIRRPAPMVEADNCPEPDDCVYQRLEQPSAPFERPRPIAAKSLEDMLRQTDAGFSETLLKLIDQTGKKDSEIYTKANVSRQHFSKIRNNRDYRPTKATALAFAIALKLDMAQTRDLIGRAGYALTNSSKFDVIIMYFIQQQNYDLFEINATLFEFDQSLLGA